MGFLGAGNLWIKTATAQWLRPDARQLARRPLTQTSALLYDGQARCLTGICDRNPSEVGGDWTNALHFNLTNLHQNIGKYPGIDCEKQGDSRMANLQRIPLQNPAIRATVPVKANDLLLITITSLFDLQNLHGP